MNQNGHHEHVAVVDSVDEHTMPDGKSTTLYDSSNPVLKPAREVEPRKKSWKRKLISWSAVLILMGCATAALYLLLKVNRVNVKVDADSRHELQNAKPKTDTTSENELTEEAIRKVREAAGTDNRGDGNARTSASPNSSPNPTPTPGINRPANYTFTGSSSPVWEQFNEGSKGDATQQQNGVSQQPSTRDTSTPPTMQNHANATNSIFVDDSILASQTIRAAPAPPRAEIRPTLSVAPKTPPAILPPFGTMLPVRTQGVIFTLRNNSYARLELTRDSAGTGWSLPKGTVFVGHTTGNEYDRAFVNVIGYIDPRDNKLVKLTGDVLGIDGASGIPGKQIGIDHNRLKQTLRKVASSGLQVAGMMSGALGRGTVILDRSGYPIQDQVQGLSGASNQKNAFVKVAAGQAAYVMVSDLPKTIQAVDAPGDDELVRAANSLSDREVMELILFGSPDEIRAAIPLMTDEQRKLALKTIAKENQEK